MNIVTVILKNGIKISDKVSDDEAEGIFFAWGEYLKTGKAPQGQVQLNGLRCGVFDPREIACIGTVEEEPSVGIDEDY